MEEEVEKAVGNLYAALYKMRKAKMYQQEYDAMGTLINMLSKDRQFIRENYKIEI